MTTEKILNVDFVVTAAEAHDHAGGAFGAIRDRLRVYMASVRDELATAEAIPQHYTVRVRVPCEVKN